MIREFQELFGRIFQSPSEALANDLKEREGLLYVEEDGSISWMNPEEVEQFKLDHKASDRTDARDPQVSARDRWEVNKLLLMRSIEACRHGYSDCELVVHMGDHTYSSCRLDCEDWGRQWNGEFCGIPCQLNRSIEGPWQIRVKDTQEVLVHG